METFWLSFSQSLESVGMKIGSLLWHVGLVKRTYILLCTVNKKGGGPHLAFNIALRSGVHESISFKAGIVINGTKIHNLNHFHVHSRSQGHENSRTFVNISPQISQSNRTPFGSLLRHVSMKLKMLFNCS